MYKGDKLLDAATDANGAVGLGNKNLFQSYIICSEHGEVVEEGVKRVSTKLTYGKIAAGISKKRKRVLFEEVLFLQMTL